MSQPPDDRDFIPGAAPQDARPVPPPARERIFTGPLAPIVLAGVLGLAWLVQDFVLAPQDAFLFALSSAHLRAGLWWTLVSHMFLHGGLFHLLMNASALVAFGTLPARWLGPGLKGGLLFLLLFLLTGVAGGALYIGLHANGVSPVVGASGAVCGIWAVMARLMDSRGHALAPIFSRTVGAQTVSFAVMNLILVVAGGLLGGLTGGGGIAWEAHVGGFLAGLVLAPGFGALAGKSRTG